MKKNGSDAQLFYVKRNGLGYFTFINKGSNKAIDVYGAYTYSGANVGQWTQNSSSAQQWKIYNASGYPDGYVRIKNRCGKYLDVSGAGTSNGTNIQIWDGNSTKAQVFKMVAFQGYNYKIFSTPPTAEEKALMMKYPQDILTVYQCSEKAKDYAKKTYGYNGYQDNCDAYRHCLWNALMTRKLGFHKARLWATAHEGRNAEYNNEWDWDKSYYNLDTKMDLYNNARGQSLPVAGKSESKIASLVKSAVKEGKCARIVSGKNYLVATNGDGMK